MKRRDFLKASSLATLAAAGFGESGIAQSQSARPPNIVLIVADDLGYGHLGCYGQQNIRTPNIDRLAAEGMRFTQAYSGAPLCAPSRCVLMTGLHGGHAAVRGNSGGIALPESCVTVAEVLRSTRYATGLFGKWGLGDAQTEGVPHRQGFDEFFGYLHQRHAQFYYTDYLWYNDERYPLPGNMDGKRTQYSHDVILDKALEFIRANRDRPFFCFLPVTIPHHEWTVPEESLREYTGKFEEKPHQFRWREGYALPKEPKANLAAMITYMDKGVGRVMDLLKELALDEDTLVVFSSDNGADRYSLAEPEFFKANGSLREYKGTLYEGGIRVPAIARWPGHIAAASESDFAWTFSDILPTLAELAGAESALPAALDGLSILPSLLGSDAIGHPQKEHEFMYWEMWGPKIQSAVRAGKWKAIAPGLDAPVELYDLESDPGEQRNLATDQPSVVEQLRALMAAQHQDPPPQTEPEAPDGRQYR
ncbi:MAG: arylsulfatase [Candidatus Hydrogenedentes bacterium]|nr:arylsulfatase [Candidatus Hydrogenedentota bacterium]